MDGVRVARDGPLLLLTLDRPKHENRLTSEVLRELARHLDASDRDDRIAAVALTGAGEWFCAGAQMPTVTGDATEALLDFGDAWLALRDAVSDSGKPFIAAVNGRAFAGGLALTALADLAFAVPAATFGLPELQYGIFPMLVLATVIEHLPRKVAFDLIYRGRVLDAAEAARLSIINEVVEAEALLGVVRATTDGLSRANPVAVRLGRRGYHAMDGLNGRERMELARHVAANLLQTKAAAAAYRERTAGISPNAPRDER